MWDFTRRLEDFAGKNCGVPFASNCERGFYVHAIYVLIVVTDPGAKGSHRAGFPRLFTRKNQVELGPRSWSDHYELIPKFRWRKPPRTRLARMIDRRRIDGITHVPHGGPGVGCML